MNPKKDYHEIYDLLIMLVEGDLADSQAEKLVNWSKTDPDAVKIYADFMNYYSLISSELASGANDNTCSFDTQFDRALADSTVKRPETTSDSNTSLRGVDLDDFNLDAGTEDSEGCGLPQEMLELLELVRTSPAVEKEKPEPVEPERELIQKVESNFKWFPGRPSKRKTRTLLAMVASIMVFIGYVYFFAPVPVEHPVVAKLGDSINAVWDDELELPDEFGYMVQSRYGLKKGYASILFNDGARITVEGPAELSLNSSGDMELFKGKIYAVVPDRAKGFSVKTASSKIVDLGTEFGIEVDNTGNTQLHVTKGKTLLFSDLFKGRSSSVNVDAGAAKKVYNDGLITDIEIVEEKFVTRINSKTGLVHKGRTNEVVYEPFDYSAGRLQDVSDWKLVQGSSYNVESTGLSYGKLPVSGGHLSKPAGSSSTGFTNNFIVAEIAAAGLLADGQTLWMSAVAKPLVGTNATLVVRLGTDYVGPYNKIAGGAGDSIGFNFQNGNDLQARYHIGGTEESPMLSENVSIDAPVMVVIEMKWNADSAKPDTINYYLPDADLNMGTPVRTIDKVAFDQAAFDTFSVAGNSVSALLDEIRFGKSYIDIIGGAATEYIDNR